MQHQDDISERILAARRDADLLKERIKQRKEALADTTCKNIKLSREKKTKN
jgi:guanine nucleotide-binding protein G(I)/G(S)/G(T) subunit beta-1